LKWKKFRIGIFSPKCYSEIEQNVGYYYSWQKNTFLDKRIPYVIDDTFNETAVDNIHEAIDNYNVIFENCIKWVPRTSEVKNRAWEGASKEGYTVKKSIDISALAGRAI
jgi:hypothetical protein